MTPPAILHVTSLFGGGVDRHLRDVLAGVARPQLVWHAGEAGEAIEEPAAKRFFPLAAGAFAASRDKLAAWLASHRVGLVHLHALGDAPRERAVWAARELGVPLVVTLHDVLFLDPAAFERADPLAGDAAWLAKITPVLRSAARVMAPSVWLAELASERIPGLEVEVIPNGAPVRVREAIAPREDFSRQNPARVVALLGAIGPHKGSDLVDDLALQLAPHGIALVVVGYLDRRLFPGWRSPGSLFVHGAFEEGDAPGLLLGYGASLVLFPNAVPDSFSYALSDAWAAGVPVLAAPVGAIAARIREHGGGWLLADRFDAPAIAREIASLVGGDRESERARVQSSLDASPAARVPAVDDMTRSLDALYARYGIEPAATGGPDARALEALVATNLDGNLFRTELVRLCDEMAQTLAALEATKARASAFETEARGWIAKLEGDVAAVQAQLRTANEARDALAKEADELRLNREALGRLPSPIRRLLLKLAFDARR
ncbi:MAG: glycosyltransferase [Betaproteobacteria bacterium]|nr:glycosyltransferase [Betaproteobacteria bacterium]